MLNRQSAPCTPPPPSYRVASVRPIFFLALGLLPLIAAETAPAEFTQTIRPTLEKNCAACHNPADPKARIDFLKAQSADDMEKKRGMWRSVASQLRNRTMPPAATKLTEDERLHLATWIDNRLRDTACSTGPFTGAVAPRRLNRREYHHTIRDIFGLEFPVADAFPADESGGAGFDTNGETLYVPPMMLERYMEAAQKILDRVIITPPFTKQIPSAEMTPPQPSKKPGRMLAPAQEVSTEIPIFVDGKYNLRVSIERPHDRPVYLSVKLDGADLGRLNYARDSGGGPTSRASLATLARGIHSITVVNGDHPVEFFSLFVEQRVEDPPADKRSMHYRLFGLEPGEAPLDPSRAASQLIQSFLAKAYRRPVTAADAAPFLTLYERSAKRGDPYEECVKIALKAVLVSPRFLFHVEDAATKPGTQPISQYDMASRLSYFLWSTAPDAELLQLAAQGRLQDPAVLAAQTDRMINDPRSRAFASSFVGQWLGTQEVGGRVVPLLTELQHYYTPEGAAELRQEPVLLYHYILSNNRSLLELLTANYTFLTARLAKYYEVENKVTGLNDTFRKVQWPDENRAGVLGMAGVLAMTSHYKQGSPVLRGAWVLDTLLGTPVPPPPADVPPLETTAKSEKGLTMRQILARHRADPACASCHNLMDPIGFGLENFDWMGRWRDLETNGKPVDASGKMPSGETFNGPVELRKVLLNRKDEFLRHLTGKTLGYALGRGLQDGDQCTVQRIADKLAVENYSARTLIREIVLSSPFRNTDPSQLVSGDGSTKKIRTRLLGEK